MMLPRCQLFIMPLYAADAYLMARNVIHGIPLPLYAAAGADAACHDTPLDYRFSLSLRRFTPMLIR